KQSHIIQSSSDMVIEKEYEKLARTDDTLLDAHDGLSSKTKTRTITEAVLWLCGVLKPGAT
ncbi:unnamed protein product, partial [Ceratitis capitata]